jgi:hypothetical protein
MANTNPKSIFAGTDPNQLLPNSFGLTAAPPLAKVFTNTSAVAPPSSGNAPLAHTLNMDDQASPQLQRVDFGGGDSLSSAIPDRPQAGIARAIYAPSPEQQHIDALRAERQRLTDMDARPYGFAGAPASAAHPNGLAPNHPGVWGHIAHVLSTAGQIAGEIVAPNVMAEIPGTQFNRRLQEQGDTGEINHEQQLMSQNQERDAQTQGKKLANAEEPEEAALGNKLTQSTIDKNDAEAAPKPVDLAHAYGVAVQRAIAEGRDPMTDPVVGHLGDAIQNLQKQPAAAKEANPQQQTYDDLIKKGMTPEQALEKIKEKPPVVNVNAGEARQFQEQERGRGLLDKAEQNFRTAQQGADTMRDMVGMADAGNKMSAQVLPLEGALEITTAQGVHRINKTEVEQYAGAGSLFDKVAGELGKVTSGQPIPPNIRKDIRALTDAQEKQAYSTYKSAFDSATHRYKLNDEQPLPSPGGDTPAGGGQKVVMRAPDGSQQEVDASMVEHYKKLGAQVVNHAK